MKLPPFRAIVRAYLVSLLVWCGIALLMGFQASPFNRQNPREWFVNLLVEVAPRAFAMTFWTPPIFYLVRRLLNSSINRFAYVLLWSAGAVPFVLLHTTILWILIPPTDIALQSFGPRSLHSLVEMLRTSFADIFFIYVASWRRHTLTNTFAVCERRSAKDTNINTPSPPANYKC